MSFSFTFVFIYFDVCLVPAIAASGESSVLNTCQKYVNRTQHETTLEIKTAIELNLNSVNLCMN